jgi:hypothetical protein
MAAQLVASRAVLSSTELVSVPLHFITKLEATSSSYLYPQVPTA